MLGFPIPLGSLSFILMSQQEMIIKIISCPSCLKSIFISHLSSLKGSICSRSAFYDHKHENQSPCKDCPLPGLGVDGRTLRGCIPHISPSARFSVLRWVLSHLKWRAVVFKNMGLGLRETWIQILARTLPGLWLWADS